MLVPSHTQETQLNKDKPRRNGVLSRTIRNKFNLITESKGNTMEVNENRWISNNSNKSGEVTFASNCKLDDSRVLNKR